MSGYLPLLWYVTVLSGYNSSALNGWGCTQTNLPKLK